MSKNQKRQAREKQREARSLLNQSKMTLQIAVLETDPAVKNAALSKVQELAQQATALSEDAAGMIND